MFTLRQILGLISVFWLIADPCRGATEIPFTFKSGMIWLEVRVADRPMPLHFLLDSGAGQSVIHLGVAQRLGMKLGASETIQGVEGRCVAYRVEDFAATVSSLTMPRTLIALDLSPVSAGCGARIDGLLGADFFRNRIVQIDFPAQKIRLLSRGELPAVGAQVLPLCSRNDAFCVRVGVDGNKPDWMRLDTGCSSALEWVVVGAKLRQGSHTSVAASVGSREQIRADVLIGSEHISAVKTGLHQQPIFFGEAGLIGNGLLGQFCVTVDTAGERLLLERTK